MALESLNFSNKINESKQGEGIFSDNQLTNLVNVRLKKIIEIKNSVKTN